ncbi:hypothetical protein ACSX1A_05805 [Pontibacter sp. MBLB2868]|uniref:hypothetical protein n=1 Tax=Pontibacter sp. MBLB2868 TaxID=3451555 RepID=UPI003F756687
MKKLLFAGAIILGSMSFYACDGNNDTVTDEEVDGTVIDADTTVSEIEVEKTIRDIDTTVTTETETIEPDEIEN